jgi:hypothetical protein
MKINKAWHLKHKMPKNANLQQRLKWHIEHQKHCSCRPMPERLEAMANAINKKQDDIHR